MFARQGHGSFEVHKLRDESGAVAGYCKSAELERLRTAATSFEMHLYPELFGSGTELVSIPFELLKGQIYKPARGEGNAVTFRVSPF